MMESIIQSFSIKSHFRVDLGKACNCQVGLVEITLPPTANSDNEAYQIDLCCSEIDRTFTNPNRLLRRIFVNKPRNDKFYRTIQFEHILYKKIDSSDRYLNFHLCAENGNEKTFPDNEDKLTIVLSFIPKSDKPSFIN